MLNDVPSNGTLTFSYVGLQPQDVRIEGRTTINVEMKSDTKISVNPKPDLRWGLFFFARIGEGRPKPLFRAGTRYFSVNVLIP